MLLVIVMLLCVLVGFKNCYVLYRFVCFTDDCVVQ